MDKTVWLDDAVRMKVDENLNLLTDSTGNTSPHNKLAYAKCGKAIYNERGKCYVNLRGT